MMIRYSLKKINLANQTRRQKIPAYEGIPQISNGGAKAAKGPRKQDGLQVFGGRQDGQSDDIFSMADELVQPGSPLHDDKLVKREEIYTGGLV